MRGLASKTPKDPSGHSAFAVALCLLGVMAMAQLVVGGMALAVRFKEIPARQIVEKEVIREVRIEVPTPINGDPHPVNIAPPSTATANPMAYQTTSQSNLLPPHHPSPLTEPEVEDPKAAKLLSEAREARVAGDMVKAIVKLEQALQHAPGEPSMLFELGIVHEQMGIFDIAADHFEEVFLMGMPRAGALYPLAAAKLRDGFSQPIDMLGKLSLGRVKVFKNTEYDDGQQVILTIPVQKAPTGEVEMDAIEVEVRFFNRSTRGEVAELSDASWVASHWVSLPWDWAGGGEQLRMTYTIPKRDDATNHLFGEISYYGQVVTLSYKGEVLDVQAWPRDLAARVVRQPQAGFGELPVPEFQDMLPPDFDPNIPLLPTLQD